MKSILNEMEHLIDDHLYQNEYNYMILANLFTPETAPSMLGYPTDDSGFHKQVIVNADPSKITLYHINSNNHRLADKEPIFIPYEAIVSFKISRSSYWLRNKLTIETKENTFVLDYADRLVGLKDFKKNRKQIHNLIKTKFILAKTA
ncbi:MAG: hypothetical protein JXB08_06440 [Bacilli bacterium]|nr:hypothetical protein [Bacilli bacterium]MBN2876497.1 hypothetical protein [Bacilli bacterium]